MSDEVRRKAEDIKCESTAKRLAASREDETCWGFPEGCICIELAGDSQCAIRWAENIINSTNKAYATTMDTCRIH
eukprot:8909149-Pyramimonas_sp.AAC.1